MPPLKCVSRARRVNRPCNGVLIINSGNLQCRLGHGVEHRPSVSALPSSTPDMHLVSYNAVPPYVPKMPHPYPSLLTLASPLDSKRLASVTSHAIQRCATLTLLHSCRQYGTEPADRRVIGSLILKAQPHKPPERYPVPQSLLHLRIRQVVPLLQQ